MSVEGRGISAGKSLEPLDREAGLAADAAQRTDGDLLVARHDHDDHCVSGSPDGLHVAASADLREPGAKQLAPDDAVRERLVASISARTLLTRGAAVARGDSK